jgi:hypothetical protein
MAVFSYSVDKWVDVLGIQFRVNFLLPHISEFYKETDKSFQFWLKWDKKWTLVVKTYMHVQAQFQPTYTYHPMIKTNKAMKRNEFCYLNVTQLCRIY